MRSQYALCTKVHRAVINYLQLQWRLVNCSSLYKHKSLTSSNTNYHQIWCHRRTFIVANTRSFLFCHVVDNESGIRAYVVHCRCLSRMANARLSLTWALLHAEWPFEAKWAMQSSVTSSDSLAVTLLQAKLILAVIRSSSASLRSFHRL